MEKSKTGFTLAEVLISMAIIGVIMALSINSIRVVKSSYTSLTYFAHKNVVDMVGVLYAGTMTSSETEREGTADSDYQRKKVTMQKLGADLLRYDSEVLPPMVTRCINSKGKIVNILKTDGELYASTVNCNERITTVANTNLFCKSLVALTNVAGKHNCNDLYNVTTGAEPTMTIDFNKPNFTLANGMRYYISKWQYDPANVSVDYGYRLISVDLNGKSNPNKAYDPETKKTSDLVTFLILDNGEVYPLGVAADNVKVNSERKLQYLNARVKGYYFSHYKTGQNAEGKAERQVIERDTVPSECANAKDDKYKCNFGVVPIENPNATSERANTNFSYREALCTAKKTAGVTYIKYCSDENLTQSEYCPPSDSEKRFDMCRVETVKPMFRYNF